MFLSSYALRSGHSRRERFLYYELCLFALILSVLKWLQVTKYARNDLRGLGYNFVNNDNIIYLHTNIWCICK